MKNLKLFGLLAIFAFFMSSCEEDGGIIPGGGGSTDQGPSVLLLSEAGFISFDADIAPGENVKVKLDAIKGDVALKTVTVSEDGSTIPFSRLMINGTQASANPVLLFAPDTDGLTWEIEVMAPADTDAHTYSYAVADESNLSDAASISITRMLDSTPPSVTLNGSGAYNGAPGSLVGINLNVAAGGTPITGITVYENGNVLSDASRLYYGDTNTNFDANPFTIPSEDQGGFSKTIYVRNGAAGFNEYVIELTDQFGNTESTSFSIQSGTPIDNAFDGVLLNSAGPAGTGGLDLETGTGTGSSDMSADIKDEGIDMNETDANNWIQRISGANGTTVKYAIGGQNGLIEGFQFEWATSKEEIEGIYGAGVDFATSFSGVVQVGDIFTVYNGTNYFLIVVREVNVSSTDNSDNYVFDIKY